MITGRWGKPSEVLLDLVVDEGGVVRVEEYTPPPLTLGDRLKPRIAGLKRWINARSRPTGEENARKLRERGESLNSITFRDAVAADIPRWPNCT